MTCPKSHLEAAADSASPVPSAQSALSGPATSWDQSQPCCLPPTPTPVSSPGPGPPDSLPTPLPNSFSGGPAHPQLAPLTEGTFLSPCPLPGAVLGPAGPETGEPGPGG